MAVSFTFLGVIGDDANSYAGVKQLPGMDEMQMPMAK